ncbi:uncharacterized protein LOC113562691 isoform X2 [Ooceraea biroi]|uniref:uncharacterized protein LOC113562691 isoform X2 n=1 Tax=Ooceraea biroi TaxID=2015173 RepID=UPI000F092900|nr:uncharacterized protein LOC113562691 isoform X2 [Ooceraea biroi]
MNKSVENLLISSHEVISSINSSSLSSQNNLGNVAPVDNQTQESPVGSAVERSSPVSSPNLSPRPSPRAHSRREYSRLNSDSSAKESLRTNKSEDQLSQNLISRSSDSAELGKSSSHEGKKESRGSDRSKKKSSWYNVLYPTYKSRSEDFKRIFKDVPDDEKLVIILVLCSVKYWYMVDFMCLKTMCVFMLIYLCGRHWSPYVGKTLHPLPKKKLRLSSRMLS